MVKPRAKSKRVPLARRYNIHKKAKEHERKAKRDAKKNPSLRKKLNKDPGIPNLNPFKADLLRKMEAQKKLLTFQDAQRARKGQELARLRKEGGGAGGGDLLSGLVADAMARDAAFAAGGDGEGGAGAGAAAGGDERMHQSGNAGAGESTRRAFYRHVKQVLEKADIILEVLDARDPLGCRAYGVEALALACNPPKRVVLVLNKIDLVPPQVVQQWLAYLRRDFPTVAFKASTQQQRSHISAPGGGAVNKATESGEVVTGSGAAGADTLLQLIKNYSRSHELKQAVTVGIVGYPNVGKSSLINSLKRGRAVGVSATPGFTRVLQEVSLDSKVTLIDCPGVIFNDDSGAAAGEAAGEEDGDAGASLLLRNCISVDQVEDPEAAVDGILSRCAPEKLMALYAIPAYGSTSDFLTHIAVKRGKLTRGGVPDKTTAARTILQDWNSGKIPFFVLPPEDEEPHHHLAFGAGAGAAGGKAKVTKGEADVGTAAIVSQWSKEFGLDEVMAGEAAALAAAGAAASAGAGAGAGAAAAGGSASSALPDPAEWIPVKAGKGTKAAKGQAQAEAQRFLAVANGEDEEEEDEDDDDDDMSDDDDDEEDDEDGVDEDEDEDEDEMSDAAAEAALAAASKGRGKAAAAAGGKGKAAPRGSSGGAGAGAGAGAGVRFAVNTGAAAAAGKQAYDFSEHIRRR